MTAEPVQDAARNSRGRFARTVANIDRDRQAAEAVERGATYDEVAARFGYHDRQTAYRAVQKIRRENTMYSGATQEVRQRQLDELAQVRREAWERILHPLPAISRTGKVVTDEDGNEVPDVAGIAAMLALVVRTSERESRLTGTEMPRKSISLSGKMDVAALVDLIELVNPSDWDAAVQEYNRRIRAAEAEGPPAIPGAVEED